MTCGKKHCDNAPTEATKVDHTEVEGRPLCDHPGCEKRVVGDGTRCADGHVQGLGQRSAAPPYTEGVEAMLSLLTEVGATAPVIVEERALQTRQQAGSWRTATPAMQEIAAAVEEHLAQLVADESIRDPEDDHYEEVMAALALAYGDPDMPTPEVETGAREGMFPDAEQLRTAAGPMFWALENLLARRDEVLDVPPEEVTAICSVLARGYGQPDLTEEQVLSVVGRGKALDEGADPEEDARVTLNMLLFELRELSEDSGDNWEGDPRTQRARAATQRETKRCERAALTELNLSMPDVLDLLDDLDGNGIVVTDQELVREALRAGWEWPLVLSSAAEVDALLYELDGYGILYNDSVLLSEAITTRHPGLPLNTEAALPAVGVAQPLDKGRDQREALSTAHRDWNPTGDSMEQMLVEGGGELPAERDGYPIIYLTANGNQLCAECAMDDLRLPVAEEVYGVQGYRLLDEPGLATCCDECQHEFYSEGEAEDEEG